MLMNTVPDSFKLINFPLADAPLYTVVKFWYCVCGFIFLQFDAKRCNREIWYSLLLQFLSLDAFGMGACSSMRFVIKYRIHGGNVSFEFICKLIMLRTETKNYLHILHALTYDTYCTRGPCAVGQPSNCSVAFAIYIHIHYNYRANEIIFEIPGLLNPINFLNSKQIIKKVVA